MKENDGLPQNVCIRCVGTLEFFCDFYDCCHTTQKEFLESTKNKSQGTCQRESDAESDKENVFPPSNDARRKAKALSLDGLKSTNEILSQNSSILKRKSLIDTTVEKDEETIVLAKRSESMNSAIKTMSPLKGDVYKGIHSKQPSRRKRGRKSQAKKMEESSLFSSLKRKLQDNINNEKVNDNQYKRHCLRTISMNSKSNEIHNSVIPSKSQIEKAAKGQIAVDALSNEFFDKNNENDTVSNNSTLETNNKGLVAVQDSVKKQSKAISVIVKQEKGETTGTFSQQARKTNQLVWIPSDMLMQGQEDFVTDKISKVQQNVELLHLLKEETKEIKSSKSDSTAQADVTAVPEDLKSKVFIEQNRETVIRSSQSNENIIPKEIQENKMELDVKVDTTNKNIKDDSEFDESDMSLSQRLKQNSKCGVNKKRDKSFGKISELISNEQKEAIETYYMVDMSIVNSAEVQQNLTIIDKKNIRCNICGTFYLRMDKCQVHIWGHLQMKPYKCKQCNFATVTVSNIRCHIRKSHLKIKPFACHLCERKYATSVLLEEHINTHTGDRPYKCKLCNFASASRQMLNYHNTTHKPVKDITCKVCNKEFYSRGRLRAHMVIHNKDKVVMCQLCSAYLSSRESLKRHHRNVHMKDYACIICGKRAKSRKALHNHQNVHSAAKYKCPKCPNVYKSSQILKEHLLKHEGIRKYKCKVCEKSFGQQSHLAAHMAVHSKIRFYCPACNKSFNRPDNMKIHTKRCKLFLENPDLKDCVTKGERTTSFSKTTELNEGSTSGSTSYSETNVENQTVDPLAQSEDEKEKCKMNLCKLGLNISYIDSVDKEWSRDSMYSEAEESTGSVEINLIQITNINETLIPESENLIRENILGPESF